jgi:hypothetical protein
MALAPEVANKLVRDLYLGILNREPDDAARSWAIELAAGRLTPERFAANLRESEEGRARINQVVRSWYIQHLGREPDAGAMTWANLLVSGRAPAEIERTIATSQEGLQYRARQGITPPKSPSRAAPAPRPDTSLRDAQRRDAFARIKRTLADYGLSGLADWAWKQILADSSEATIMLDLQDQPAFKQRFRAIDLRRKAGLPAISPAEVIAYETQARTLMRAAGLPKGFYDKPDDFTDFLVKDVGLPELQNRIGLAEQAVFNTDPVLRAERARFGITTGEEVAMALDAKTAFPLLRKRYASAGLSAVGVRSGYGALGKSEAEHLFDLGITEEQAGQGFDFLTRNQEIFQGLPGMGEDAIDRATGLSAVFEGSAPARETLERRARQRRAVFEAGGAFSPSAEGVAGLGSRR